MLSKITYTKKGTDFMKLPFGKGLIVSSQALSGNPLKEPYILARLAKAAELGGAVAIRANGADNISEMKKILTIPIIGINKMQDSTGRTVITPTFESAKEVFEAGADVIAMDMTFQESDIREDIAETVKRIHNELKIPVMADIACADEAARACEMGVDLVSTTLSGYLPGKAYSPEEKYIPDFKLIQTILNDERVTCPCIGEGRFWTPQDLKKGIDMGLYGVVIGKAITNAMAITSYFTSALK